MKHLEKLKFQEEAYADAGKGDGRVDCRTSKPHNTAGWAAHVCQPFPHKPKHPAFLNPQHEPHNNAGMMLLFFTEPAHSSSASHSVAARKDNGFQLQRCFLAEACRSVSLSKAVCLQSRCILASNRQTHVDEVKPNKERGRPENQQVNSWFSSQVNSHENTGVNEDHSQVTI